MAASHSSSLCYGMLGAGRVAREHVKGILSAGGTIAAVHDAVKPTATSLAQFISEQSVQHGSKSSGPVEVAESVDEFLARDDVDAVVIAVPNVAHRELAVHCLQAGKDVLLEKPMAMNVAECDAIRKVMQEHRRILQLGFVCRGSAKVHAARELIQAGALGEVYHVKASMYRQRGIPGLGGWFTTRAMSGGGVLVDIGVHLIDLVMHLTDSKRALTVSGICEQRFGSPIDEYVFEDMWAGPPRLDGVCDVEDSAMGLIRFDTGVSCELNVAWASNMPQGLMPEGITMLGDRGGLFFDLWGNQFILTTQRDGKVMDEHRAIDTNEVWDRAWQWQHERFAEAVASRTVTAASAEGGRAVQEVLDAWRTSSDAGREVVLNDGR